MQNFVQQIAQPFMKNRNSNLCSTCRPLFSGRRKDKELGVPATEILPQTIRELEHSAAHGCDLCRLRWEQLQPDEREDLLECNKITYGFWQSKVGDGIVFEYWTSDWRSGMEPRVSRSIKLKKRSEVQLPTTAPQDFGTSTSGVAALAAVRRWLRNCDDMHPGCRKWMHPDTAFMPTRLIKVGAKQSDGARLCYGAHLPNGTRYMVLSHCWGGEIPLQLRQCNEAQFHDSIPGQFPKTFSDAFDVVRALGQEYIWIDSLCIIQDSTPDWQNEARLMGQIYENAWCSIAATMAKNSFDGLFSARNPLSVYPVAVHAFWFPLHREEYILWDLDVYDRLIDKSKLMHRGWVVQERILAPRVLHFTHGIIIWECSSLRATETFPYGVPDNKTYKTSMETKHLETGLLPYRTPVLQLFALWQAHVHVYSQCDLTEPQKDKLFAIAGIARKVGSADDYAAGLWKSVMINQLRWSTSGQCSRPSIWRAPSWSWASIDGTVFADAPYEVNLQVHERAICTIRRIDVRPATADAFGPILPGARLEIEAPLMKAKLSVTKNKYGKPLWWMNDVTGSISHDTRSLQAGETVFCMPLASNVRRGSEAIYGIIIEPTGTVGVFERCGVFYMAAMNEHDRWAIKANEAFSTPIDSNAVHAPLGVVKGSNWKRYAITLV